MRPRRCQTIPPTTSGHERHTGLQEQVPHEDSSYLLLGIHFGNTGCAPAPVLEQWGNLTGSVENYATATRLSSVLDTWARLSDIVSAGDRAGDPVCSGVASRRCRCWFPCRTRTTVPALSVPAGGVHKVRSCPARSGLVSLSVGWRCIGGAVDGRRPEANGARGQPRAR